MQNGRNANPAVPVDDVQAELAQLGLVEEAGFKKREYN
jgi:hypothetical protein